MLGLKFIHYKKCPVLSILNPDSTNTVSEKQIRLAIVTCKCPHIQASVTEAMYDPNCKLSIPNTFCVKENNDKRNRHQQKEALFQLEATKYTYIYDRK